MSGLIFRPKTTSAALRAFVWRVKSKAAFSSHINSQRGSFGPQNVSLDGPVNGSQGPAAAWESHDPLIFFLPNDVHLPVI